MIRGWLFVRVCGKSMEPTLRDGQRLFFRRVTPKKLLRRGAIVVFSLPRSTSESVDRGIGYRIKRVAAIGGDRVPAWARELGEYVPADHVVVSGDNATSEDSRQLGFISRELVLATR